MAIAAAIDLGSNALRMVIGTLDHEGRVVEVENHREPVRLGGEVFTSGLIPPELIERVVTAFERFRALADRHKVTLIRAVATSAMRDARNRGEVVRQVQKKANIEIEIIPGEEEARLGFVAVQSRVKLKGKTGLLIDIGGGSLELSVVSNEVIVFSESLKMGAVRLLQLLEERKRGAKLFSRLARQYVDGIKRQLKREVGNRKLEFCIGTGGNIETLGELRHDLLKKDDSDRLTSKDLEELLKRLSDSSYDERVQKLGLRPDRADVILPACVILDRVMKHAGLEDMTIPHVGLKDGVLIELLSGLTGRANGGLHRQGIAYALEIGKKYAFDEPHAVKVAELALQLFDASKELHKLKSDERQLLELASLLHDVGQFVHMNDHHKHTYYLLRSTPLVGLSGQQKLMVALIARYHRKSLPKPDHEGFQQLKDAERSVVEKLGGLLRLAEALDCQHEGVVSQIALKLRKGVALLSIKSSTEALLERWAVTKKCDLFEKAFDVKLELED